MKRRSAVLALALAIPLALGAAVVTRHPPTAAAAHGPLAQNADQTVTARLVYGLLSNSRYAYRAQPLNDALSKEIFKKYFDALDGNKMYFTADEVAGFEAQRAGFDAAFSNGDMKVPFAIFETYRKHARERIAAQRALLNQDIFTFTGNDRFEYDREKAAWADKATLDQLWKQSVRNDWLRLKLAGKQPDDIRKTLDKRYANAIKNVDELDSEDVFQLTMNAYTNATDPHTDYFNPRAAERFNQQMSLSLQGIGAQLQKQDDVVIVRELVPGGPAAISKLLRPGDRVVAVGQGASGAMEDVIGWRIDDVVEKIRGAKGTRVRLGIVPPNAPVDSKPRVIALTRDIVKLTEDAAKGEVINLPAANGMPARKVGVIKLPSFYEDFSARRSGNDYASASRDVARLLTGFKAQNVDGVVLDMRNNGGGSLGEAVRITGLFVDTGPVVQIRQSGGRVEVDGDDDAGVTWAGPLAVLVNRGTASASEIVAGAIQDYGRGLIIGETTFGKGTVQNLVDLDRFPSTRKTQFGQVKMTIAQFFRPSGSSTQNKGVEPDIHFPVTVDASNFGESMYDNALPWSSIPAAPHQQYGVFGSILPQLDASHEARIKSDREYQWLLEDLAEFKALKAKHYLSMNEGERRAEREKNETKLKTRQAERKRLGLPLDPLADDATDDGLAGSERDIAKEAAREKLAENRPDPLLRESAAILTDAMGLLAHDSRLASQVLPQSGNAVTWVR
ncbi:carboxy terminal-processing peptidase [Solilutibacter silvestris]|uniref:Prc: C-terminal processing peptidase n=1 Tax=Solilutibacter silvestris TaxID=1645665 RepID=A0A2K1Q031_9GAMM|nr:carboxy terminal-processing peptidase [Lysobacter silvestris]PNS08399.1 prc: C-terminal processing peptidase [Lysobacter silvestris]